jgi:S-adenosylmethionine uptake transporter
LATDSKENSGNAAAALNRGTDRMQSLWMIVAAFLFSIMGVFVKLASSEHSTWEILFWRSLVGLVVLMPIINRMQGGLRAGLSTKYWSAHTVRNLSGTMAASLWFASLAHLPIAVSMTLNYSSSLFIGVGCFVGAAWGGNAMASQGVRQGPMLFTLFGGFIGIVLILRPTLAEDQLIWALMALSSGALAAVALMTVRALGRLKEPSIRIVFYFTLSMLLVSLIGMSATGAHWPTWHSLAFLVAVGATAVLGQLALTRAYGYGQTLLAANLNYAGILFATLWGWWFWNDHLPWIAALGMLLVVGAGIIATWLTANTAYPAPEVE